MLPQRLSSTFKHVQVDGILTPSEMSCLNAGCRCKDLAGFLPRPRSILSFLGLQLLCRSFARQFLSRGRSYTQHTFSRKRMDPLLHVAMVVYPKHPASKVVSTFLCLGAGSLKHSTARSTSFRSSTARSCSTRQPPALYQPPAWGLLRITHLAT